MEYSKPELLYASPFPPQKSGISDYSVILVNALSQIYNITLFVDSDDISEHLSANYKIIRYGTDDEQIQRYKYRIYNVGNHPGFHGYIYETALRYPGMIILHDYVLYYLFVGYYEKRNMLYSRTYKCCGLKDFLMIKEAVKKNGTNLLSQKAMATKLEMNDELLNSNNLIMVHSEYSKNKILEKIGISQNRVKHINLIRQIDESGKLIDREILFRKYKVPQDALIVSSFGYIAETKLNKEICEAVKAITNGNVKICYVMVGEGDYADEYLEDDLIVKTGYTDMDEFNSFLKYSDIIVNLRYPSMGETSAAMLRILQMGKPCITNNGGWFSEIPDNCVKKIDLSDIVNNLQKAIEELISNSHFCEELTRNAHEYIDSEYNEKTIITQIYDFLSQNDPYDESI